MAKVFTTLFFLVIVTAGASQTTRELADSIRKAHHIPELNYAVVAADKIIEIQALGNKKAGSDLKAELTDRFRIGSNTKTITSYMAWLLVKEGKIKWETKFFDLYPELKPLSNPAYYNFTLKELITFRAHLPGWSYGNDAPAQNQIKGNARQQRYEFTAWILQQEQPVEKQLFYWSNPAYVAAGLMLEKASGKDYETLTAELGKKLDIEFDFGQPNFKDSEQPWGHDEQLIPEKPADSYKLNWLSSAGNINVSLPGYVKFIQLQLKGLNGKSNIFTAGEFNEMHYGLPEFAYGWLWETNKNDNLIYSFHTGNPGTFLSQVFICKDKDIAFVFFANVQSAAAEKGLQLLLETFIKRYGKQ